ncbi:MAG: beta-N-acetylhexosaminidase [Flavobacteriales bacterium]|nr:beta-N-acetylhexosaminidase [Flavobacteriales bacterium]
MKQLLLLFLLLGFLNSSSFSQNNCPVLPTPTNYVLPNLEKESAQSNLPLSLGVDTTNLTKNLFNQLNYLLGVNHQMQAFVSKENPIIQFKKLKNAIEDSYTINITKTILISYTSERSCFYALQSLMQLIENKNNEPTITKCYISDYPNFKWRGLHLDVARHFFTVEEVKRYIDLMAIYKFNTFHWHLTDDQGWRIEIKKYPKLTAIGAWRDSTVKNHYTSTPRTYDKNRYGGFYTQEEIKAIVKYAAERYITIVPEIEMPGHARAALAAYPEFSCTGKQQGVEGLWGVFDDIFCAKEETILFLQDILAEVITLFPGQYVHIGGDEAPKNQWKKCEKCQHLIKENKLKDEHELQSYFIQRMDKFLVSKGKKLIGWDEILEGGLSPNAAVMSWRGFEGGIEAAKQGHDVVMSPGSHCYFDHYQGRGKSEPLAFGGYTSLEKVYDFNPIPKAMKSEQAAYILGGQANLWTEYIDNFQQVEYMVYPRAIALSQVLWCQNKPSFQTFEDNLINYHLPILEKRKVNFAKTFLAASTQISRTTEGIAIQINSKRNETFQVKKIPENRVSNINSNTLFSINRSEKSQEEIIEFTSNETQISESVIIKNSPTLGLPLKLITLPNPRYNNGDLTLVDGNYGSLPWKGNEWLGFDTSEIIFEIDLLKKQKIKGLELSFLKDEGSWIQLPTSITIEQSNGKKSKTLNADKTNSQISFTESKLFVPFSGKASKLRITIHSKKKIEQGLAGEGHQPWTFIDEIRIVK